MKIVNIYVFLNTLVLCYVRFVLLFFKILYYIISFVKTKLIID